MPGIPYEHPVKDRKTWDDNCKWRLDPSSSGRWDGFDGIMDVVIQNSGKAW